MRNDDALITKLRGLPLFRGLTLGELEDVVRLGHERTFAAGDPVFREGDDGRELFVILRGTVGLEKGTGEGLEPWRVAQLGEGAVLGEMALLTNEPRSLTAIALAEVTMMSIGRNDFERLVADTGAVAVKILRNIAAVIASRLRKMDEELHRFYSYDATRDKKIAEIIRMKDKLFSQWEN